MNSNKDSHKRVSIEEALLMYHEPLALFEKADIIRKELHPNNIVTYIVDRNINYTNICITGCSFCGFYRKPSSPEGYVITEQDLEDKILEAKSLGAVQILLQGGHHPKMSLDDYLRLIKFIKSFDIHLHGFSPPEIHHFSKLFHLSVRDVLIEFIKAGLDSIPGGGAEILVDNVRKEISPHKCTADEWLMVMRTAHKLGMRTTATMMFGHKETLRERIEHLQRIRDLQDETRGFTAFIPWTYQPAPRLLQVKKADAMEYLKTLSISRIFIDNIKNIQASWVTQGEKIGQIALRCGANDMGSTMIEENVVRAAGTHFDMSADKLEYLIKNADFMPRRRNMFYELIDTP